MAVTSNPRQLGQLAETAALDFLRHQGLRLVARNWRCRLGELDLVMQENDTLVFVEVRYRRHQGWGGALSSVTPAKQQKLIRAAQSFLQQEPRWSKHPCRFDVIAPDEQGQCSHTRWIRDAFGGPA